MKPVFLFTAAIAMVLALPAEAQVVGVASAVKNDVRLRKPNTPVPRPVQLQQRIAIADLVQTGAKSQMQMVLLDRSVFTLGANARVTIDRYVYDPARNSRSMGATVGKGAFRFMSGRRTTGDTRINAPAGTIGVRGTILEGVIGEEAMLIANGERGVGRGVRADPETATLIVLRGPGRATSGNVQPGAIDVSAGGRTVTADRPMQAIYIPYEGAAPIGPFIISEAGLGQMQALLYPSVADRLGWLGPVDPNRTFTEAPTFESSGPAGRFPRGGGFGPEGGVPGDDGPPGTEAGGPPLPLDRLRGAPQPQPRRTQQPVPTPPPSQPGAVDRPPPPASDNPNNKPSAPIPAPVSTPAPKPAPAPTPSPVPSLKTAPNDVAPPPPVRQPTPSPTPAPNQKGQGQNPPGQQPPGKPTKPPG